MTPLRIHVLALRDCTAFVPVGLVDLLRKATTLAASDAPPGRVPSSARRHLAALRRVVWWPAYGVDPKA